MFRLRLKHTLLIGFRSLFAHKLRSSLTALGIVLGVGSVIVMLAVGEAARHEALRQLEDLGANTILLRSVKPQEEPTSKQGLDVLAYGLTDADLGRIRATVPTVVSAMPMREFRKTVRVRDRKLEARLVGVTPDFLAQNKIRVGRGRELTARDERALDNVCVLGAATADVLFPVEDPIGRTVNVEDIEGARSYTVVGVTEPKTLASGSAGGEVDYNRVVFIPFASDRARIGRELYTIKSGSYQVERIDISQITVHVDDTAHVPKTATVLQSLLDQFHPQKDVTVTVPLDLLQKAEETQRLFSLVLGAIAGISLVVGGIGIMNIMLATVTERTREIGVRRALGAKRRDIALQFLLEAVVLSGLGGMLGVALGVGLSYLLTKAFDLATIIRLWSPLLALAVSVAVGLVSGSYPARRAARLDPIEALRHE